MRTLVTMRSAGARPSRLLLSTSRGSYVLGGEPPSVWRWGRLPAAARAARQLGEGRAGFHAGGVPLQAFPESLHGLRALAQAAVEKSELQIRVGPRGIQLD